MKPINGEEKVIIKLRYGVEMPERFDNATEYHKFTMSLPRDFNIKFRYWVEAPDGKTNLQYINRGLRFTNLHFARRMAKELTVYVPS